MSWRQWAAAQVGDSSVFHLSEELLVKDLGGKALCGQDLGGFAWVQDAPDVNFSSIREARERGLHLCKKCRARTDEVFARLLEVDGEVGPDDRDPDA